MVVDSTLTFAARRNVPTRYSRDLVAATLKTMQRVSEIRARRERVFYKNRMAGNSAKKRAADRKLVEENQHMLPEVRALLAQQPDLIEKLEGLDTTEEEEVESREKVPVLVQKGRRKKALIDEDSMDVE